MIFLYNSFKLKPNIVSPVYLILENAFEREKDVQDIDVPGEYEKLVVTLLVIRGFSDSSGASRACADFRDSTTFSRLIYCQQS